MNPEETAATRSTALNVMPMSGFSIAPTNFEEAWRVCQMIARSGFCPPAYRGKPEDVFACLSMGADVGLPPMQALQSIAVINGRPSLWGDGQMAVVLRDESVVEINELTVGDVDAAMSATDPLHPYIVNPKDGDVFGEVTVVRRRGEELKETMRRFSVAQAKRAKLWMKRGEKGDSTWVTYPERMLQMRARSWALRDSCSDLLRGLGQAEELLDSAPEMRNVTSAAPAVEGEVLPPLSAQDVDRIAELAKKLKWSAARIEVERKTVGFDDNKLLEKMEAEAERGKQKRPAQVVPSAVDSSELQAEQRSKNDALSERLDSLDGSISKATNGALFATLAEIAVESKPARLSFAKAYGVDVDSYSKLTEAQGRTLLDAAKKIIADTQQADAVDAGRPINTIEPECPACEAAPSQPHFANCPEAVTQGALL